MIQKMLVMLEQVIFFFGLSKSKLHFSKGNIKMKSLQTFLKKKVTSFDLPSGYTCPAASSCQSFFNPLTRKIEKGENTKFLCYSAKLEGLYYYFMLALWNNLNLLVKAKRLQEKVNLIQEGIKPFDVIRIHSAGDYYSKEYFQAWKHIALLNQDKIFFGYTKVLSYVMEEKSQNYKIQYSFGSIFDQKAIDIKDLPICYVIDQKFWNIEKELAKSFLTFNEKGEGVFSREEKEGSRLISVPYQKEKHEDYLFIQKGISFGILIH